MVVRKRKVTRRISIKRDDMQWRVSNSLLILAIGLMFMGCGSAEQAKHSATGYLVLGYATAACEPPQPLPSAWSECSDGLKKRVMYGCNQSTGRWDGSVESAPCEEPFKELPVAYMLVGLVLVVLAIASLMLYKTKHGTTKTAQPGETPAAPQW
jgi:hypothetical protein